MSRRADRQQGCQACQGSTGIYAQWWVLRLAAGNEDMKSSNAFGFASSPLLSFWRPVVNLSLEPLVLRMGRE